MCEYVIRLFEILKSIGNGAEKLTDCARIAAYNIEYGQGERHFCFSVSRSFLLQKVEKHRKSDDACLGAGQSAKCGLGQAQI